MQQKEIGKQIINESIVMEQEQIQQCVHLTPTKKKVMQATHQKQSYIKFKQIGGQSPYIPKFRISASKSNEISFSYIYRFQSLDEIGNIQQWSQSKQKPPILISNQLVSDVKRKGLKDYTIKIKREEDRKGNDDSSVILLSMTPFKADTILNYFEIKISQTFDETCPSFEFGITDQQVITNIKSSINISFKLNQSGNLQIYRNSARVDKILNFKLKTNDVVGCGFLYHRNQIILTHNGKKILYNFKLSISQQLNDKQKLAKKQILSIIEEQNHVYYPFIIINSKKILIQTIFQNSYQNFTFQYSNQLKLIQEKLTQQQMDKNSSMTEQNIYGLVLNYYKFHGFDKTASIFQAQMKKRNMCFYPQNQPIKNKLQFSGIFEQIASISNIKNDSTKQKKIKKKNKKSQIERQRRNSQQDLQDHSSNQIDQQQNQDQDEQKQQKSSISQQKSDNDQFDFDEPLRSYKQKKLKDEKKTLQNFAQSQQMTQQKLQNQKKRKEEANQCRYKKLVKKTESIRKNEQQKFKIDRLQIVRNIKDGKLQQAYKLFNKSYKRISKKQKYIQIFFKANIFLKLYHQQGLNKALEYAKKQHKHFTQFENYLFPFFKTQSIKNSKQNQIYYRPLRQILFLICPQNRADFDLQNQLRVFSQFINQILCEQSGYMSSSKLELVLSHYSFIQNKVNQFGIPIGGIDLQSMNCL